MLTEKHHLKVKEETEMKTTTMMNIERVLILRKIKVEIQVDTRDQEGLMVKLKRFLRMRSIMFPSNTKKI
jgi:hypothetical protein